MIGKLIYFELMKKWRSAKYLLLGYLGIQALTLLITRIFLWNSEIGEMLIKNGAATSSNASLPFVLSMILFFMLALALGAFPFIEGIYRFERDLSGKQAYLELMIPAVSWQKLLAKLVATLCSLIVCGTVSLLSMILFFLVNCKIDASLIEIIRQCLGTISKDGLQMILVLVYMLFGFASIFMIVFFCISIAKSFTHKNTVAVPIGILTFIVIIGLISALAFQLDKVPLVKFNFLELETSLSRTLADIMTFLAAMAGTSWLMEKRIEH